MALTVSVVNTNIEGARKAVTADITFDSSYATGGEAISLGDLGLTAADFFGILPSAGYVPEYIASSGKIKVYWVDTSTDGAAMAEVASTTDLSAVTFRARVYGY